MFVPGSPAGRSFADERGDDCPTVVPLVEFAITDSASPLANSYTVSRTPSAAGISAPLAAPDPTGPDEEAAHLMGRVTAEVWALLQERQDLRKADPSATWGAELLLDTEHTPLPSRSLLFPPRAPTRAGSRRGASSPSAQRPYLRRPDYGRFEQVTGLPLSRPARPPMFAGAPAPIPPAG